VLDGSTGNLGTDALAVANRVLGDTVSGTLQTATVGTSTLLVGTDAQGAKQGLLTPGTQALSGALNDGALQLQVQLPANLGFAFQGRDSVQPQAASEFLNSVVDSYVPASLAGDTGATYRASLQNAVSDVMSGLQSGGTQGIVVRMVQFVSGKPAPQRMQPQALGDSQDVVLDAGSSSSSEVFAVALAGLGATDTLVLKGVEGAVLAGAGRVRVDGSAGARIASDLAAQTVTGSAGNDVLVGNGNDVLTGGAGADVFGIAGIGHYTIMDLTKGVDKLAFKGVSSVEQLVSFVTGVTDDSVGLTINFGPNVSVQLVGVHAGDLSASMVQIGV
jgi:hypothetical protein